MTLIMWGSLFGSSITENVAITDTLDKNANFTSEGLASNGFSYWSILFYYFTLFIYLQNIFVF